MNLANNKAMSDIASAATIASWNFYDFIVNKVRRTSSSTQGFRASLRLGRGDLGVAAHPPRRAASIAAHRDGDDNVFLININC